jgi:GNAT superfamily N-acetyltransferase
MVHMTIRPADDDDHDAYARLFAELGVPEAPPTRATFSTAMRDDVLVATDDTDGNRGAVIGTVWARPRGALLHIVHLMTDPTARRRGFTRWMLTVKPDNVAARALYESMGMVEVMASAVVRLPWAAVSRLPRADGDLAITVAPLPDDVDDVPTLGLLPGELKASRGLPGRIFVGASVGAGASATLVGVAGFDPAFPGSPLFRVASVEVAGPLLQALQPHARPVDDVVNVYVEGQPAVRDALVAVSGEVVMRVLRLEGPLPFA